MNISEVLSLFFLLSDKFCFITPHPVHMAVPLGSESIISINSSFCFILKCTRDFSYPFLSPTLINFSGEKKMFKEPDLLKLCCGYVWSLKAKTKLMSPRTASRILSSKAADTVHPHVKKFVFWTIMLSKKSTNMKRKILQIFLKIGACL
jgi:hypothetical protein